MTAFLARIRIAVGALALAFVFTTALPVAAQQATQINPTAQAVQEQQLLKEMNRIDGRCTLPDQKACLLEQPAGRDWRHFHQVTLPWIGAIITGTSCRGTSVAMNPYIIKLVSQGVPVVVEIARKHLIYIPGGEGDAEVYSTTMGRHDLPGHVLKVSATPRRRTFSTRDRRRAPCNRSTLPHSR